MRILITGGAGFIGSHLAEACLQRGDEVIVLDNLSTGSIENILPFKQHPRFSYSLNPVENRQVTAELVDLADVVIHLAAAVGVRLIVDSPVHAIETNVNATTVVLEMAAKKKKRVLVASTSEVYGKRTAVPFRETDDLVLGPSNKGRWSYACSKALDEFLALAYWREKGVPTTVVRLFNTVGPRQTGRYGMVIPCLVRQALAGQPMTIYGDGTQRRCFLHVQDCIAALWPLVTRDESVGQIYNVGSDEEVSILELANRIHRQTRSESLPTLVPYEQAYGEGFEDMQRRVPDTAKLRALTGFQPRFDLDRILADVIADQGRKPMLAAQAQS